MQARIDIERLLEQGSWLRALARRLARDHAGADDLVQETFAAAIEHPPRGADAPGALRAWLAAVLRNFARAERRRERVREHCEPFAARAEASNGDPGLDQVRHPRGTRAGPVRAGGDPLTLRLP